MTTTVHHGVSWLASACARPSVALSGWASGGLAEVPIGPLFDVVRVIESVAQPVLERLRAAGAPVGPVLMCEPRSTWEFLVEPQSLDQVGPLLGAIAVTAGPRALLRCPRPGAVRPINGRSWLVWPAATGALTHGADLVAELRPQGDRP
ncbi:hypothetical protein [Kitasatospora sp. NPDC088548]|uniref:hypothetical protein n=1 Tax=Kitasatospora sp. NPDC088548 TaxID=3364075 RepID=UPI003811E43C